MEYGYTYQCFGRHVAQNAAGLLLHAVPRRHAGPVPYPRHLPGVEAHHLALPLLVLVERQLDTDRRLARVQPLKRGEGQAA